MNKYAGKPAPDSPNPAAIVALLDAISDEGEHTQRTLAVRLDVALGLANALIKRCVSKGLVKIQSAPARRYAYYLTPKGFAEKSRLVAEYLTSSLDFFRHARSQYEEAFVRLQDQRVTKIALAGIGELAEIALLSASSCGIEVVAVIAAGQNRSEFHGRPIMHSAEGAMAAGAEVVVITDTVAPQRTYETLQDIVGDQKLVAPPLLHVTRISRSKAAE